MFGPLMHVVKWLEAESIIYGHYTGTVKRKAVAMVTPSRKHSRRAIFTPIT